MSNRYRIGHSRAFVKQATADARRARRTATSAPLMACVDCGKGALVKPHTGASAFPVPRCVKCACEVYAAAVNWPGAPATVETTMIADPQARAFLSRPSRRTETQAE